MKLLHVRLVRIAIVRNSLQSIGHTKSGKLYFPPMVDEAVMSPSVVPIDNTWIGFWLDIRSRKDITGDVAVGRLSTSWSRRVGAVVGCLYVTALRNRS